MNKYDSGVYQKKIILNFRAILSDENVNMLTLNIKFHAFCEAKPNIMQMNVVIHLVAFLFTFKLQFLLS